MHKQQQTTPTFKKWLNKGTNEGGSRGILDFLSRPLILPLISVKKQKGHKGLPSGESGRFKIPQKS